MKINGHWENTNGKIIVYLDKTKEATTIETGQTLVFASPLQEVEGPLNPHEFNYKNYLERKNIFYTAYLKDENWKATNTLENSSLFTLAQKIRKQLLDTYRNSGLQETEFSLVAALVLGYDDEIDPELMNAYSHTGTLHVLSVSGLHVGIIYVLLGYMLSFFDKKKKLIWLKVFLILGFLWFFVLLSGFSAPAVRAALMFSLILTGKTLFKNVETANIVFVAAFASLCYNPYWLADAGFQLSYVAVLGIIYLYPYFYNRFTFSSGLADKIWALCSVSIAAQLATLPITLYYFHQFPVLFLITNLVLIPVSTIVMYGGILVLLFSKVAVLAKTFVWLTAVCIKFMNTGALFFDNLPFCVVDNIHLSIINMVLMYVLIMTIFIAIEYRSVKLLFGSFSIAIFMLLISLFFDLETKKNNEFVIYHSDKSAALGVFTGNKYIELADSVDERLAATLRENKIYHDFVQEEKKNLSGTSLLLIGNKKVLFSRSVDLISQKLLAATQPDLIWLPAKAIKGRKDNPILCQNKNLIVSGTIWSKKKLECLNNAHITKHKGAFIVSLR